jgi:hypothetical protein
MGQQVIRNGDTFGLKIALSGAENAADQASVH